MQTTPAKPCGYCGSLLHWPYQCFKNPYLKKFGWNGSKSHHIPKSRAGQSVHVKLWARTRRVWFINNLAEFYTCHYCGKSLMPYETTLDHKSPRSRSPELRYEQDNLVPCCWVCNRLKGSVSHEEYKHICH